MNVTITLTSAGAGTGPFDLYSDLDGYIVPFETAVPKSSLITGYTSTIVPDGTQTIRVQSIGVCSNYIDINISGLPSPTPTNTPTVTPTITPTETPTNTPTETPTVTPTNTNTPTTTTTNTPTTTTTPTNTQTPTPTSTISAPPSITYITFTSNTASLTTYTFNNVAIGGSGLIAISVHNEIASSPARSITSATVNGNAAIIATQIGSALNSTSTNTGVIYYRVTSGTTANISITFNAAPGRCGIGVWRIQNNISDTPIQTKTATAISGTGLTITFSSLTTNNIGVCAQTNGTDGSVMTWTNATENYDNSLGAGTSQMSGANFLTSTSGNRIVSTTHANSSQPMTLAGVVWN